MAPSVALGHILLGLQALHHLDHLEVGHAFNLRVIGEVEVLLGEQDALLEEVLVNLTAAFLGDQHDVILLNWAITTRRLE